MFPSQLQLGLHPEVILRKEGSKKDGTNGNGPQSPGAIMWGHGFRRAAHDSSSSTPPGREPGTDPLPVHNPGPVTSDSAGDIFAKRQKCSWYPARFAKTRSVAYVKYQTRGDEAAKTDFRKLWQGSLAVINCTAAFQQNKPHASERPRIGATIIHTDIRTVERGFEEIGSLRTRKRVNRISAA